MFLEKIVKIFFLTLSLLRNNSVSKFIIQIFVSDSKIFIELFQKIIPICHELYYLCCYSWFGVKLESFLADLKL